MYVVLSLIVNVEVCLSVYMGSKGLFPPVGFPLLVHFAPVPQPWCGCLRVTLQRPVHRYMHAPLLGLAPLIYDRARRNICQNAGEKIAT